MSIGELIVQKCTHTIVPVSDRTGLMHIDEDERRSQRIRPLATKDLLSDIVPYDGPLKHGENMVDKIIAFVRSDETPGNGKRRDADLERNGR